MATSSKRPGAIVEKRSSASVNGAPTDVMTLSETASFLRVAEADVESLAESHRLPGQLIGGEWRFLRSAVERWLAEGTQIPAKGKEAILAVAGKFKDDPDLMRICREAYERRGRTKIELD